MWRVGAYADTKPTQGASLKYCQVWVKGRESGSRIQLQFVYDESGRRGRVGLGQAEGKLIGFNDRGGKH